ncbi:MAG: HAD hydrolase family protein [Desulfuromonadales bacterium]|nr:HAD hydrolase family protein [Desulfuromonadales bacterium]
MSLVFPAARLTRDSEFRRCDVAFDIGQDHEVASEHIERIRDICCQSGASAKVSSIHINVWYGEYSKSSTTLHWLKKQGASQDQAIFIGDSPNDESMFAAFDLTIGVANIHDFLPKLQHLPKYISSRPGGLGFAELARTLPV